MRKMVGAGEDYIGMMVNENEEAALVVSRSTA